MIDVLTGSTLDALVGAGRFDEALEVAAEMVPRLEASGDMWDLIGLRAARARVCAVRGQGDRVAEDLDWLEPAARGTGETQLVVAGLGSAALVRHGLGQDAAAVALLAEVEAHPGARDVADYSMQLPAMVRAALGIGGRAIAERLVGGLEPRTPYAGHALVAANAALTEANGDLPAAADAYADAAERWEGFGVVPEQGFALLGQGRCLIGLSRPVEATPVLHAVREIFARLQAAPALAETDALLTQATALSS
jgi:hypothetical protein